MIKTDSTTAAPVLLPLQTFLKLYAISKSEFYRLAARGEGPDLVKIGSRTLIPAASAMSWMQARVRPAQSICRAGCGVTAPGTDCSALARFEYGPPRPAQ
jgi:predicted DNA-binding transcriptional regulator AlpA